MKAVTLLKTSIFSLFIVTSANIANADEVAQIEVQDSNAQYAHCMNTSPAMRNNQNCTVNGNCGQNTLTNFYAKEAHELNCRKQFGGPVLTYSFVDH